MSLPAYSRVAWGFIASVAVAGLGLEAILARAALGSNRWSLQAGDVGLGVALFALSSLAGYFPVKLGRAQKMNLGTAAVFAGVLLLPPATVAAASGAAVVVYSTALRRPWFNVAFSAGQHLLEVGAAALVYNWFWGVSRPPLTSPAALIGTLASALVFAVTSILLVAGVVALTQRRSLRSCALELVGHAGPQYLALLGSGALVAECLWFAPWAVFLPGVVLPLIQQLNRRVEQVAQAKQDVEDVLGRQRRFVSDLAHEIGTPLTTLAGNVQVLRQGGVDDPLDLQETLDDLGTEFDRLVGTFSHLMQLAETDESPRIERQPVSIDRLARDVADVWQQLAGRRALELEVGRLDPVIVSGDRRRLRELFGELLENASRYTPKGGRVRVEVQRVNGWARIVVADSGSGIAREDLPHIFERFYRGHSTARPARTRSTGGSGLGLAIVKAIVDLHGGQVSVESSPGSGSTFIVDIPRDEGESSDGCGY